MNDEIRKYMEVTFRTEADRIIEVLRGEIRRLGPSGGVTKHWTQAEAAAVLGVSVRQLRRYKRNPPDAAWPGWEDPLALALWRNRRDELRRMHQALTKSLSYREGVTERAQKRT